MATNQNRHKLTRALIRTISTEPRIINFFESLQKQAHDDLPEELEAKVGEYKSLLNQAKLTLGNQISAVDTLAQSIAGRVTSVETGINSLKQTDIQHELRLQALETDVADIKTQLTTIAGLQTRVAGLETSVGTINTTLSNIETRLIALETP